MNHWILGSFLKDFFAFYGPAFIALTYLNLANPTHKGFAIIFFLITAVIDTGHGYLSLWRVIWKPLKEKRSYLILFFSLSLTSLLWMLLKIPGFWSLLLYFTIYHHIRQYYGITRWYQKKNNRFCTGTSFFLYTLTILPVIAFHFRNIPLSIYSKNELFLFPSSMLYESTKLLYYFFFFTYFIFEFNIFKSTKLKNNLYKVEKNRILSVAFPSLIHGICFLNGQSAQTIILPLLVAHGLSYFWIVSLNVKKNSPQKKFQSWKFALIASSIIMLLGGSWESFLDQIVNNYNYLSGDSNLYKCLALALIVTPNLWHYIIDGIVWKSKDADASTLYSNS